MKLHFLSIIAVLFFAEYSYGCQDFSGEYQFADAPWNGTIRVEQNACTSVSIALIKNVPATPANPTGKLITVQNLKMNGRAYVGTENSSQRADMNSTWFQKVSIEKNRLVLRQYSGAVKTCGNRYSAADTECHLTVYTLNRQPQTGRYSWIQTGVWWTEDKAATTQKYALIKAPSLSLRTVAGN